MEEKDRLDNFITIEELNSFYEKWKEFKGLVKAIDVDMKKASENNRSAGLRARHGLRMSKTFIHEILMEMLDRDKKVKKLCVKRYKVLKSLLSLMHSN